MSDAQEYRFGSDTGLPVTLDEGGTMVNRIGAVQVQFDTFNFHGSPDFPPNGTITDGDVYLQSGNGPQMGPPTTLFYATFDRPYDPGPMESFINQGFVTTFPGAPAWSSAFPGDTWIGGFRMPTIEYGPNPWSVNLYRFDPSAGNQFPSDPCDCFAVLRGNTFVMAVVSGGECNACW